MKKNKLYEIEPNEQKMIDSFKAAVSDCFGSGLYFRNYDFQEVHTKDGYCIIALLDYGKFTARLKYNPQYLFVDYMDVKLDLGGQYKYSIYDIFNLFNIDDFNQYYYSDIELEENISDHVKSLLEMINKYSYDIEKACSSENIAALNANVEQDYKASFPKDKEESWREDIKDELAIDIIHPFFTVVSSATDSAKLLKQMEKSSKKGRLTTLYERRLFEHLSKGNTVINTSYAEKETNNKAYSRLNRKVNVAILAVVIILVFGFALFCRYVMLKGAFVPLTDNTIGSVVLPFSISKLLSYLFCIFVLATSVKTLFGKAIIKRLSKNDDYTVKKYEREQGENAPQKKAGKIFVKVFYVVVIVFAAAFSVITANDSVGFYDGSVKLSAFGTAVSDSDVQIAVIEGEMADEEFEPYTDVKAYGFYTDDYDFALLENLSLDSPAVERIEKIIKDNNKQVQSYKTAEDFSDDMNNKADSLANSPE